jgi:predicted acyltransferase
MIDNASKPVRLESLDALRGFTMFWIIGGDSIFRGLVKLFCNPVPDGIEHQLEHPAWGPSVTFYDLIMPLFIFIVGVSMTFSFARRIEQGESYLKLYVRILRRFIMLILLGMICRDGMDDLLKYFDWEHVRITGNTLQFIACAYLIGSFSLLHLPKWGQITLTFGLLLGYCLLMLYVPIPGHPSGILTPDLNLARYIDGIILGKLNGFPLAPTILSSMALGATLLMGTMAGHIMRLNENPWKKVKYLVFAGLGSLALGWLWSHWFIMVKWIWTSSYSLWMAGWSFLLLAVFYVLIDIRKWHSWAFPFVVIGSNAILAYLVTQIYGNTLGQPLFGGLASHVGIAGDLVSALGQFGVLWIILWYLYRKQTFLRV